MNGYKFQVEAIAAHTFLMGLFEADTCDLTHLFLWVNENIAKTK